MNHVKTPCRAIELPKYDRNQDRSATLTIGRNKIAEEGHGKGRVWFSTVIPTYPALFIPESKSRNSCHLHLTFLPWV